MLWDPFQPSSQDGGCNSTNASGTSVGKKQGILNIEEITLHFSMQNVALPSPGIQIYLSPKFGLHNRHNTFFYNQVKLMHIY